MWCHLCNRDFLYFKSFIKHVRKKHHNDIEFSDELMASEKNSDDDSAAVNISQNNDNSYNNNVSNKSDDGKSSEKCYDFDHNIATESNLSDKAAKDGGYQDMISVTLPSPKKITSSVVKKHKEKKKGKKRRTEKKKSKTEKKERKAEKKERKAEKKKRKTVISKKKSYLHCERISVTLTLPKKNKSSILKKRVPKKKTKKNHKRVLLKRKKRTIAYQENGPKHVISNGPNHSENSLTENSYHTDAQSISSNNIVNSMYIPINNIISNVPYFVNPNAWSGGNQAFQPYIVVAVSNSTTPKTTKSFDFNSSNILKWLTKYKELCKNIPYPLPKTLFYEVRAVHKAIFDRYSTAAISEEASAVLNVYEELDCMIQKHINSINNTLIMK